MGQAPSCTISANQINPYGYSYTFCLKYKIQPVDVNKNPVLTPHYFEKDLITVVADPVDCSSTLTPLVSSNLQEKNQTIDFNSTIGSSVAVIKSYQRVFSHFEQTDCKLTSCLLMNKGCLAPLASLNNILIS